MKTCAIILARGGSKGILNKNIIDFCGKPLLAWTIEQCLSTHGIDSVWVSSDSEDILSVAREFGAQTIKRPDDISDDQSSSEVSWKHAIEYIEQKYGSFDIVLAPQVTSPLRESRDIENGLQEFIKHNYDSMFSCSAIEDFFIWEQQDNGELHSVTYDYLNRKRRQDIKKQFVENGSFYLFKPSILKKYNNRLGEKIGKIEMEFWKMFEIDNLEDIRMCRALMQEFLIK
jgi:CMP-N,N'-diacetyllegionaminic acid synthase